MTAAPPRLIQLSGVILDQVFRVAAVPRAGQEAEVKGLTLGPGGGFNAMVAARRWGMAVDFAGTLGTGPFADMAAAGLAAEGIGILRPERLAGKDQGTCVVLIDDRGERTFIARDGADGVVTDAMLARLAPRAEAWLLLSGYALGYAGSREALARFLTARPPGRLVFDPGPLVAAIPPPALAAAMSHAAWISANAPEARHLTGHADPAVAAVALAKGRAGAVVRTGADGCWLATPGQPARPVPAYPVTPIDTNGAGDTHVGTFIAALAEGHAPPEAARLANIAAALSTTEEGPSTAPAKARVIAAGHPVPAS